MERRGYLLALASLPLLVLSGCGSGTSETVSIDTTAPPPQPEVAPEPVASPAASTTAISPLQLALVRPTDPDTRLKQIKTGRTDPFGSVAPPASSAASGTNPPGNPSVINPPGNPSRPGSSTPSGPILPALPEPTQARGVKVTGIVIMAGMPRAIVTAPDEPTSRTVSVGDSLSNGLVRVRAIDAYRPDPVVILEQYGTTVEVPLSSPRSAPEQTAVMLAVPHNSTL